MNESEKKHPCPDCLCCQWCSDSRCGICLRLGKGACPKLSLKEQVELYESINAKEKSGE